VCVLMCICVCGCGCACMEGEGVGKEERQERGSPRNPFYRTNIIRLYLPFDRDPGMNEDSKVWEGGEKRRELGERRKKAEGGKKTEAGKRG